MLFHHIESIHLKGEKVHNNIIQSVVPPEGDNPEGGGCKTKGNTGVGHAGASTVTWKQLLQPTYFTH